MKGRISAFIDRFAESQPRGEFVIVCEGATAVPAAGMPEQALEEAKSLVRSGVKKHKAARIVAKRHGLKGRDLYDLMMADARDSRKGEVA